MTMTNAELEGFREYVNSKDWKFAKTYAHFAPHEYIVNEPCKIKKEKFRCYGDCEKCLSEREEFEKWVKVARENSEKARCGRRIFNYFCIDGYQYWTFDEPLDEVICFNRAIIGDKRCKLKILWLERN